MNKRERHAEQMNIETMIFAYLAICVSMILFNIVCIFTLERNDRKLERKSYGFEERVKEQFAGTAAGKHADEGHGKYLARKLKNLSNLMAFDETLERLSRENPEDMSKYLSEILPVFIDLTVVYRKKNELKAAYLLYIIQKYGIVRNKSNRMLGDCLLYYVKKTNLYCRENALKVLYTTGDAVCVMQALKILDESTVYHSPKLLTDGLLSFEGNHEEMIKCIWESFADYSVDMKVSLLNYIRFQSGKHCRHILMLLEDKTQDQEVHFACIRYFGKYPFREAYPLLLDYVEREQEHPWQYAAIAALALASYPGRETEEALKRRLHSSNWYVRMNASRSLEMLDLNYLDLIDIFEGDDRYAGEILRYQLDRRQVMEKEDSEA